MAILDQLMPAAGIILKVRKLLPWSLLILLGLGTGLGAALAVSSAPQLSPAAWVSNVLSRTAAAGSARFTYTHITMSSNRDERNHSAGFGQVDFITGNVQVVEVDHDTELVSGPLSPSHPVLSTTTETAIGIGSTMYSQFDIGAFVSPWITLTHWRSPRRDLGLLGAENAGVALQGLIGGLTPVDRVRDLGPITLNGYPTTRYLVSDAPPQMCPSVRRSTIGDTQGPSTMWIDPQGRLVQVKIVFHDRDRIPKSVLAKDPDLAKAPMSPSTTTATLRFLDFGVRVHVTAPATRLLNHGPGQSKRFAIGFTTCGK